MGMNLSGVVPWGRNIDEYREMFLLTYSDMKKKIAGFGDGPASFNCQASEKGADITSFDPVYQFSEKQLRERINEVRDEIIFQMTINSDNYVWDRIKNVKKLEKLRMSAMEMFLSDFEKGRSEGRYVPYQLPDKLPYSGITFDIGLSSHFLLMYTSLGFDFHVSAISEMLRVCREVRIFPVCDLDGNSSEPAERVTEYFSRQYRTEILKTDYQFQKGADSMLRISNQ